MARVTADIEVSWSRLTAWLAQHAPVSFAALRPPASVLDPGLPDDLRTLLMINDGAAVSELTSASLLPGLHRPLPAEEIEARNAMLMEILEDLENEDMDGRWWHAQWIMFADSGAGAGLMIDNRPGPERGRVSEWDRVDGAIWDDASSLREFIAAVADAVENGAPVFGWRPVVEDGDLDWEPVR
jgi:cell wall assembly regulator SMI1